MKLIRPRHRWELAKQSARRIAAIDMISDRIPDETTIFAFRHLLEKHDLWHVANQNEAPY